MVNLFSFYEKKSHAGTNFPERQTNPKIHSLAQVFTLCFASKRQAVSLFALRTTHRLQTGAMGVVSSKKAKYIVLSYRLFRV